MAEKICGEVEYLIGILSDTFKDAHGFRPTYLYPVWATWSLAELEAELSVLSKEAMEAEDLWEEIAAKHEAEYNATLEAMVEISESEKEYWAESLVPSSYSFAPFWVH
jgi:hypothetical protein